MRCEDVRLELPSYALGELDGNERDRVEKHLSSCASCAHEAAGIAQLAELVGDSGLDEHPPSGLKDATFTRLEAQDLGFLVGSTAAALPPPDLKERALTRALTDPPASRPPTRSRPRGTWLAAAAAVIGLGIAAGSQARVQDLDRRLATMQASVQHVEESYGPVGHPMQAVQLAGSGANAQAELVHFRHDNYRITVKVNDIDITPPEHHYEVWLSGDDGEVSIGSFRIKRPDDLTLNFTMGVDPGRFPEVLITREPTDGDPAMSSTLVARAELDRDSIYHGPYEE